MNGPNKGVVKIKTKPSSAAKYFKQGLVLPLRVEKLGSVAPNQAFLPKSKLRIT